MRSSLSDFALPRFPWHQDSLLEATATFMQHFPDEVKISGVTFLLSNTLVCQFLLVATTKRVFLWYRSQSVVHLFFKLRVPFTWTKNTQKNSYHDRDYQVLVRNVLISLWEELTSSLIHWWMKTVSRNCSRPKVTNMVIQVSDDEWSAHGPSILASASIIVLQMLSCQCYPRL